MSDLSRSTSVGCISRRACRREKGKPSTPSNFEPYFQSSFSLLSSFRDTYANEAFPPSLRYETDGGWIQQWRQGMKQNGDKDGTISERHIRSLNITRLISWTSHLQHRGCLHTIHVQQILLVVRGGERKKPCK